MPSSTGITTVEWAVLTAALLAVVVYLVASRRLESRRIERKFPSDQIVATSFGVGYFGLSTEPGGPLRSSGALVLLKDGIYYHARLRKRELFIPADRLRGIDIVETHKGRPLYQKALALRFLDDASQEVRAAFRIPMPDRWLNLMRRTVLVRPVTVRDQTKENE